MLFLESATIMKKEGDGPPPLGRGSRQAVPTPWWLLLCLLAGPAQGPRGGHRPAPQAHTFQGAMPTKVSQRGLWSSSQV